MLVGHFSFRAAHLVRLVHAAAQVVDFAASEVSLPLFADSVHDDGVREDEGATPTHDSRSGE